MKKIIILLFSIGILPLNTFAQTQDSLKPALEVNPSSAKAINVDSLLQLINNLQTQIEQLKATENELRGKIYDYEQEAKTKSDEINKLNKYLIFADSIVARLSNDCLRKKYDQSLISQAVANFEKMYSTELKSKFGRLKILLNEYGDYTQEIVSIFIEVQNDKSLENIFTGQKRALSYIDKIKKTRYYRDVYSANWTIPYLNKLIDKSIKAIRSFNPRESKELNLLNLMK